MTFCDFIFIHLSIYVFVILFIKYWILSWNVYTNNNEFQHQNLNHPTLSTLSLSIDKHYIDQYLIWKTFMGKKTKYKTKSN